MGHNIGISKSYYKPTEKEVLEDYLKAVDLLTMDEENKLKTQVKELTNKNNEKKYLLNVAMMQKDKEVEHLRQQEIINKDSITLLSDQIALLMTKMSHLENK